MIQQNKLNIPILLLVFNRIDTTKVVLDRIKDLKPTKLYIGSDAARENNDIEKIKVQELRDYILNFIDWECEVKTLFQEKNLGCKYAVSGAIKWFFSQEEKGIVIEDDVVPSINFFYFCQEMLEKYKDNLNVGSISGRNDIGMLDNYEEKDYYFINKFICWGWASWSNRVLSNDVEYGNTSTVDKSIYDNISSKENMIVQASIGLIKSKQVNSWAYPFDLSFRLKNQLCLIPAKNMVRNIGLDVAGAHSNGGSSDVARYFDDFMPVFNKNKVVKSNDLFLNKFIHMRYKNIVYLYLFSKIEYLGWFRKIMKRVKYLWIK